MMQLLRDNGAGNASPRGVAAGSEQNAEQWMKVSGLKTEFLFCISATS